MTYIINYCDRCVSICRGHNELTNEINFHFRSARDNHMYIQNIIPVQFVEWYYFVYEWDERLWTSRPIHKRDIFKHIEFLKSEKANILNIYEHTTQPVELGLCPKHRF